jgi:hypothetical protein
LKVKLGQRIAKPNLNHDLFSLESQIAQCEQYLLSQIMASFLKSQIGSWFGKRVFEKSNRAMWEIITKPNHVLLFWKVKSRLGLERECMYASRAAAATGTGRR